MMNLIINLINMKYWLEENFICPIKVATYQMIHDLPVHAMIWGTIEVSDWFKGMDTQWGPALTFCMKLASFVLAGVRLFTAMIVSYKAWRDRRLPENRK